MIGRGMEAWKHEMRRRLSSIGSFELERMAEAAEARGDLQNAFRLRFESERRWQWVRMHCGAEVSDDWTGGTC